MRTLSRRLAIPLLLAATVAACSRSRAAVDGEREPTPETYVVVTNQAFLDMTVYVLRGSQRIRLGQAGGNRTTRLRIPDHVVIGSSSLRFVVDPIGSRRVSQSFDIMVSQGDEVRITIPPSAG